MKNIAVFASGQGSTLAHLIVAGQKKQFNGNIKLLITNRRSIKALDIAKNNQLPYKVFAPSDFENLAACNHSILSFLRAQSIDFIILAGFLSKIDKSIVDAYPDKIINTHPSLLPKFGGKGMYGLRVHKAVIENKETQSGSTIHYVNNDYDSGSIIKQKAIAITSNDNAESLQEKVKILEKNLLVEVLSNIL